MSIFSSIFDSIIKPLAIQKPVGNNMDNDEEDVRTVRTALERSGHIQPEDSEKDHTGKPLGIITKRLEDGILNFQKEKGLKVDGYLEPEGETINAMENIRGGQKKSFIEQMAAHALISRAQAAEEKQEQKTDAPLESVPVPPKKPEIIKGVENMDIVREVKKDEDNIQHFYKDHKGNVTIGIGNMIPNVEEAKSITMYKRTDKGEEVEATEDEIAEAFNKVKKDKKTNREAEYYNPQRDEKENKFDRLTISKEQGETMALSTLLYHADILRKKFEDFDELDPGVQRALLDMHYNLGQGAFTRKKWKDLFEAIDNKDWDRAAEESRRKGINDERNKKIYDLFKGAKKDQGRR